MKSSYFVVATAMFLVIGGLVGINYVKLKQDCTGYLERAANANTIELALKELTVAIDHLEKNDLTAGYTSVLWQTPDEDIEYWYSNLKSAQNELTVNLGKEMTPLEQSNILLKLRETLMTEDGIRYPAGLHNYPLNGLLGTLLIISGIAFFITGVGSGYITD